ncbi:MAG: ABC transporter ATP-binding protein [Candidatus Heimdallarchaeota archaeon]
MESELAVATKELKKTYRIGRIEIKALRGVDLEIKKGEFVSIVGPSGSGKSTLLHLMGALDQPTEGKVIIEGTDLSQLNGKQLATLRNKQIGFVFQAYNLINRMDVLTNVELPMIVRGLSRNKRRKKAKQLLEAVGLGDKLNRKPMELSGGEQQRVGIARALINDPVLILGDEITGNLDTKTSTQIMDILRQINTESKTTFVIITHNLEVAALTDKILYLRDGRIVGEKLALGPVTT